MQAIDIVQCGENYSSWWAINAAAVDGVTALCMPANLSTTACQHTCNHLHINAVLHGLLNGVFGVRPAAAAAATTLKQC
jgi:pyrrolidone-carboxylate peptidase